MKVPRAILAAGCVLAAGPLMAGERFAMAGHARQTSDGILLELVPAGAAVLSVPAAPADRAFVPPARVHWEVELTGGTTSQGVPMAVALRSAPADFAWPAGEEHSPVRFAGASNAMNPFENPLDPLGVASGGPPDQDQDGVPDEVDAFPGDPGESLDTDGDGTGNVADPDDDGDGMPDSWETTFGLNPLLADALQDADRDGFNNFAEYEAGTAPTDPASRFRFETVAHPAPGQLRLVWRGVPGRRYELWRLPNLSPGAQLLEGDIHVDAPGLITRDLPAVAPRDFYFLKATATPAP